MTEELERAFSYHPTNKERTRKHEDIRFYAKAFAERIVELVPPGREMTAAINKLEECLMWANAGIARQRF